MTDADHHELRQPAWPVVFAVCALATLLGVSSASARQRQPRRVIEEPPLVGQPERFSGGIGRFKIQAQVSTTELKAEDPLLLTLQVSCVGPLGQAPERPDLRKLPRFKNRFDIHDLAALDLYGARPGGHAWEYHYVLRPRNSEVTEIPPILFSYYKPGVVPAQKGYWTTATPAIPIKVTPRGRAVVTDSEGRPLRAPERFYHISEGTGILARDDGLAQPSMSLLALLFLGPPFLAVAWYFSWRRLYPDAARLAQIKRSRAAVQALQRLKTIQADDSVARVRQAVNTVEGYLRDRFGLVGAAPTPAEIESHLIGIGLPSDQAAKVSAFFRAGDAVCFAPPAAVEDLSGAAERLILTLEADPCPPSA